MRALSSTLLAEVGATITRPLHLVQIDAPAGTLRLTTWDQVFSWDGQVWTPAPLSVDGLSWNGAMPVAGRLVFDDPDRTYWALALTGQLVAQPVRVWAAYAGAPNEALAQFAGRSGGAEFDGQRTVLPLLNESADTKTAPKERIGPAIGVTVMVPAGKVFSVGGQSYRLERERA